MNNKSDSPLTLFKKPFRTEAAFTDTDRGIRIGFSRITENSRETCSKCQPIKFYSLLIKNFRKIRQRKACIYGSFQLKVQRLELIMPYQPHNDKKPNKKKINYTYTGEKSTSLK